MRFDACHSGAPQANPEPIADAGKEVVRRVQWVSGFRFAALKRQRLKPNCCYTGTAPNSVLTRSASTWIAFRSAGLKRDSVR